MNARSFPRSKRMRWLVAALTAGLTVGGLTWTALPAAAAGSCATSSPASNKYSVTVCITAPAAGATVTGSTDVTATVSVTGTNPGARELLFTLDNGNLLWDFQSPFTWTLDSTRWVDGNYTIRVDAIMKDGFTTSQAADTITFSNGITTPPLNSASFSATAGTTPAPGHPYVLAAVGDGGSGQSSETSVVNLISSWSPNLFLYLGDVYENGRPMEFNNWYGQPGLPGEYGQFYSISDPTIGNHEYVGSDISGYEWYWNNVPHYYSFNAGGWHFVSLDDISKFIGSTTSNSNYVAETKWLNKDLNANSRPCTLAYFHEPVYNVGPEGSPPNGPGIWNILAQHNVALVLNGHDHDYQRWTRLDANGNPSPTGVTEIVVGSGGHGLQQAVTTDSRLVASDFAHYGAVRLTLGSAGAGFQFVTTAGTTVDAGSIACDPTAADNAAPSQSQNLAATAISPTQVKLTWDDSTDNVGVTSYDIYRDGTLIASAAPPAGYVDQTAQSGQTNTYTVVARDAAGNSSAASDPASVTTPSSALFYDGFESGTMAAWTTSTGMTVQSQVVNDGNYSAEGIAASSPAYAYKQLAPTRTSLYYSTRFDILSQGSTSAYLLRFRTATKGAIAALYVSSSGKLGLRNDVTSVSTTSSTAVSRNTWHTLEIFGSINGTSGSISVWLDGSPVGQLTGTQSLGTNPIGYLQLGDTSTTANSAVVYDDVKADPSFIQP